MIRWPQISKTIIAPPAGLAAAVLVVALTGAAAPAHSQDFFSALFGGIARGDMRDTFDDAPRVRTERPRSNWQSSSQSSGGGGGGQAFCVRTCDGRYFPISASDHQSRAASCNSFCPASKTEVVYGSSIDHAATDNGKSYSELPNAFKYRTELVAGCTCNGKDQIGLAPVQLDKDPTLRKGDIVVGADGLMSISRSPDKRGASLNISPVPAAVSAKYEGVPVVAQE